MYYYGKASKERLSEFAKSTKNLLLYGTPSSMPKPDGNKLVKDEQKMLAKPAPKVEVTAVITPIIQAATPPTDAFTQDDLQQAIIWSEILGKPVSKRRVRRYYGN
jgi:hypothetical protein